jgi:hypothetical protein
MPANPENVEDRIVLSDDYQDKKIVLEIYTNSSLAVQRGGEVLGDRVWFDGKEKQALFKALADHLGEIEDVTVEVSK